MTTDAQRAWAIFEAKLRGGRHNQAAAEEFVKLLPEHQGYRLAVRDGRPVRQIKPGAAERGGARG